MPHQLTWEPLGAYNKYWGKITGREIDDAANAIRSDPRTKAIRYVVSDFLEVSAFDVSPYQALVIAARDHTVSQHNPHIQLAMITTDPELVKLVQLYANSPLMTFEVSVFETLAELRAWIERTFPGIPAARD